VYIPLFVLPTPKIDIEPENRPLERRFLLKTHYFFESGNQIVTSVRRWLLI